MNKLCRTLCQLHAFYESILYPILSFFGRHIVHPVRQCNAEPGELVILINHLSDTLPGIFTNNFRFVVSFPDVIGFSEFRRNNNIPVYNVGFYATLLSHTEESSPETLPLGKFSVRERAHLREIIWPNHVCEWVQIPQRQYIEAILSHHIQKTPPEIQVPAGLSVQVHSRVFIGPIR